MRTTAIASQPMKSISHNGDDDDETLQTFQASISRQTEINI